MKNIRNIALILIVILGFQSADAANSVQKVGLSEYLELVAKKNIGLMSEQLNVDAASAVVVASRVFADPEFSFAYMDNQDKKMQMGKSLDVGLSIPVSLGNKRGASIAQSKTQLDLSRLALNEYLINLRSDAALAYLTAQYLNKKLEIEQDTYRMLLSLAKSDSIRLQKGAINQVSAMQSAMQAKAQYNAVLQADNEVRNSGADLCMLAGSNVEDQWIQPRDSFAGFSEHHFLLQELLENGLNNRTTYLLAVKNKELSEKTLRLIRANRAPEFSLDAGYSRSGEVRNTIAPAPAYHSVNAGLTIPLKFSSLNRGETNAARIAVQQSEFAVQDARLHIKVEIKQKYNNYLTTKEQLKVFFNGILDEAATVLNKQIYAYQRGESSILEVLTAQQSYNELRKEHADAMLAHASALIALENAAAIWDLQ